MPWTYPPKPVAIFRHSPGEGPGYFATFLEHHSCPGVICIDAGDAVPATPDACNGLVFMGGPMSVNDPLPWVEQELALIRAPWHVAFRCSPLSGGQLMARRSVREVMRNPQKEIGWGAVEVLDNRSPASGSGTLKASLRFTGTAKTFGIPVGATRILASAACANQAFALGRIWACSVSVEMTEDMIAEWGASAPTRSPQTPAPRCSRPTRCWPACRSISTRCMRWPGGCMRAGLPA